MNVVTQNQLALREGLKIIRKVVATNRRPTGYTTAELFKLALSEQPPADFKYELPPAVPVPYGKKGAMKPFPPVAPHPEHPIRSINFLKKSVLPILEGNRELEIVRTTRIPFNPSPSHRATDKKRKGKQEASSGASSAAAPAPVTVWVWKHVDQSTIPKPKAPAPPKKVFGVEVGVGEDWSHLSKRRQRTRVGKVRRDVATMRSVIAEKKEKSRKLVEENDKVSAAKVQTAS